MHHIDPYPPPSGIRLIEATSRQLVFQWNAVSPSCQFVQYHIRTNHCCGQCSDSTVHTTASCIGLIINGQHCMFALQTSICNSLVGNVSSNIVVSLKGIDSRILWYDCMLQNMITHWLLTSALVILCTVPDAPVVQVIPIYSFATRNLSGIIARFHEPVREHSLCF